ncbi:Hypothetical protein R9X50_00323900 [Acrodontium crateriforme]|uniref:Transcription elongation factor Eaf N-terminal domain-containing protein n=1 Tax=Acrodontium crateriforme TaxID=150365 RepID=A0AAQ3M3L9_9PEZI|nr:Hypothetical protein R9X50_00323900 [Acrodontium crateriforme]
MTAAVDLKASATLPVRLGTSFSQNQSPRGEDRRWNSLRYNHKPRLRNANDAKCFIKPSKEAGESRLTLRDGDDEYKFNGQHGEMPDSYVLVFQGSGKDKEAVLERIGTHHAFNLVQTPGDDSATKLEQRYPHIFLDSDDSSGGKEGNLFGEEGDDADQDADPSNPFDYRHFLKDERDETKDEVSDSRRRAADSPVIQSRSGTTPLTQATKRAPLERSSSNTSIFQKKKKAPIKQAPPPVQKEKTEPRRAKTSEAPPADSSSRVERKPAAKPKLALPEVRLERKATIPAEVPSSSPEAASDHEGELMLDDDHDVDEMDIDEIDNAFPETNDDDDGELILEDFDNGPSKSRTEPKAMSLALSGQIGGGPISLRSAVNSPAVAQLNGSPMIRHPARAADSTEEFELGLDEDEPSSPEPPRQHRYDTSVEYPRHPGPDDHEDAMSDEDDADVEDLELPSPAQSHVLNVSSATVTSHAPVNNTVGDDDDDLDMQLALALGETDDAAAVPIESDEESEEE